MADDEFEQASAGASQTIPKQCSSLRKGDFVLLKNQPCKVVEMSTSKTGKHGHAKVHLVGLQIFTNKKYEDLCPSTHNMMCPLVNRFERQVIDVRSEDNDSIFLSLMDDKGEVKEHYKLPPIDELADASIKAVKDIQDKLNEGVELVAQVVETMGQEKIMYVRQTAGK